MIDPNYWSQFMTAEEIAEAERQQLRDEIEWQIEEHDKSLKQRNEWAYRQQENERRGLCKFCGSHRFMRNGDVETCADCGR